MTDRRRDLIRLLTEYRPEDSGERVARLEMLDLAAAAADPFDRSDHHPGHFTASAFVLHPSGVRVLVVYHRKIQAWLQPGGHIEPDDASMVAAAEREVTEETGVGGLRPLIPGVCDVDVHAVPAVGEPAHRHYDVRFAFVAADARIRVSSEVEEVRWVTLADLDDLGADRSVMRPVERLLGPILSEQ